jgi:hypothetical protein
MKTTINRLARTWRRRALAYRTQSDMAWSAGMPANRLLGRAEGVEMCYRELMTMGLERERAQVS